MSDLPQPGSSSRSPDWEAIARHLAGGGSVEERREIEQAIAESPDRAALIAQLQRIASIPDPVAPTSAEVEGALRSVLARRDAESVRPTAPKVVAMAAYRRSTFTMWRAAAAILVVTGAGALWRASGTLVETTVGPAIHHYASAVGAIESVTLSDGTRVLLGPGSELTLSPGYGAAARELTLVGEARFDVRHDASRPFTVRTASATFRDIGTVFSVHSDRSEGARIVVSEGTVAVQGLGADSTVTALHKGDRASVTVNGSLHVERSAAAAEDTAWTAGKLLFRDASVAQVVADVRRWYGIDLRVDSSLVGHHVSAEFDRSGAADVGRVVAAMLGGGFRQDGSTVYIVPAPAGAAK